MTVDNNRRILIINYGMGNIGSVKNALNTLGVECIISDSKNDISSADAFILPGVGAFPAAMSNLKKLDIVDELTKQVMISRKPFLGICLGMQLLAKDSVENGYAKGLGWIDAGVVPIDREKIKRVPHVGWNNVLMEKDDVMYKRIGASAHFFFDHSFHMVCSDHEMVTGTCVYGEKMVASIRKNNIFATQFHPEKSQRNGLKLLRNFTNFVFSDRS